MHFTAWLCCMLIAQATAQETKLDSASLGARLFETHPAIQAARDNYKAQLGLQDLAGKLDAPLVETEMSQGLDDAGPNRISIGLNQALPLDSRRQRDRALATYASKVAAHEICIKRQELLDEWLHLLAEREALLSKRELRILLLERQRELLELTAHQQQRGEQDLLRLLELEQEAGQLELELEAADVRLDFMDRMIRQLAGLPTSSAPLELQSPQYERPLEDETRALHPQLSLADLHVTHAQELSSLDQHRGFSELGLGLGIESEKDNQDWNHALTLKLELPLPTPDRQRLLAAGSRRRGSASERQQANLHRSWEAIRLALEHSFQSSSRMLDLQQQQLDHVREQVGLSHAAWEQGLRSQAEWLGYRLKEAQLLLARGDLLSEKNKAALELNLLDAVLPGGHDPETCICGKREEK